MSARSSQSGGGRVDGYNTLNGRGAGRHKRILEIVHPLSPWTYLRRNPGKTLPVAFVIVVAVALVACVVSLVDSIDLTVLTMYGYQRELTVVTPRNALVVSNDIASQIRHQPLTERMFPTQAAFTMVKTIFGKMPFVVFGFDSRDRDLIVRRCGLRLASGRMPRDGAPEVALSEDIARNQHLRLGDVVLRPQSEDSYSIVPVKLVGTLEGPVWLAVTSRSFVHGNFPLAPEGWVILAQNQRSQRALDRQLEKTVDKAHARLWTYASLVRETRDALSSLYLIMGVVIGIVVFSIAFLTGMLTSIYFTQRLPEFATLSAIGYQRGRLLKRVVGETAILCMLGWLVGAALTALVLLGIKAWVMTPRGLLLDAFDFAAYRFTLPLPAAIVLFALFAVAHRMRTLDPVSIIERRQ